MDFSSFDYLIPSPEEIQRIIEEINFPRVYTSKPSHPRLPPHIVEISGKRAVKCGGRVAVAAAAAMEFVRRNTTIPIPKVHCAFGVNNWGYIVMDFIDADTLERVALSLSKDEHLRIAKQLKSMVCQLRDIGGTPTAMGSWPSGPFRNLFFERSPPERPLRTMDEFRQYWLDRCKAKDIVISKEVLDTDHSSFHDETIVLTHADLAARNILVKDGNIVAILDWENIGWYPSFWEYILALIGAPYENWSNALRSEFGPGTPSANYYNQFLFEAIQEFTYY